MDPDDVQIIVLGEDDLRIVSEHIARTPVGSLATLMTCEFCRKRGR